MIGFGPKGSELAPQWKQPPGNVMIHIGNGWMPLVPVNDSFGPEIGFGHGMAAEFPEALFDTDDLSLTSDGMHYDTRGALELGCRFAQAAIGLRR